MLSHPSTFRIAIWPEASSTKKSVAAVPAQGDTVCVLILRLNSSCRRSIAFVTSMKISGGNAQLRSMRTRRMVRPSGTEAPGA